MTDGEQILDSPTGWVAKHARRYVESGGAEGHRYYSWETLLITTRGRRTGQLRRTPLIYGRSGERYVVVASNGGATTHPAWYLNLVADPVVRVQVGADVFTARAHPAGPDERPALWELMAGIFPRYTGYQQATDREIPVVLLERVGP